MKTLVIIVTIVVFVGLCLLCGYIIPNEQGGDTAKSILCYIIGGLHVNVINWIDQKEWKKIEIK